MQEVGIFNLKSEIKKHLKKDPQRLYTAIETQLSKPDDLALAKDKLDSLVQQHCLETDKDLLRKKLSREIGQAKKNNEDCAVLIDQVSTLSAEIKTLKEKRHQVFGELENLLGQATTETATSDITPRHFSDTVTDRSEQNKTERELTVRVIEDADWEALVDTTDHAHLYHDVRWHQLLKRNFNQTTYALGCYDQENVLTGVMPLTHMQSRLFGSFTISIPFFNYGGPLSTDPEVEHRLMNHAAKLSAELGCSHMEVRETSPRNGWLCSKKKVSMILTLPDTDARLDQQLGTKLRAQVKRASSHQLTVKTGGADLVKEFYSVYSHNMRDLGTPAYSIGFFTDIVETFPQQCFITVVQQGNRTLAAGFLIGYRDKLEIPWASSLRKYNHLGANMLMYRSVLSEAINRGYAFFDFGRSTRDANTYRFKKQWGATEYPLYWHYWTENNQLPEINPDNPKYKLVIAAWKKLPVAITRLIGPLISRNLP